MLTPQTLAALLHGREYGDEITHEESAQAKAAGLVVVFGYSDDNVELRGAIAEEIGAYDGTTIRVTTEGLLRAWPSESDGLDEAAAEAYFKRKALGFKNIEAVWCPKEPGQTEPYASWAYKTEIPHATFDVLEDGDLYCRGIVFALADVTGAAS